MRKGVSPFRWRVQDEVSHRRETVRELQGTGYTIPMIAQKIGYSVITVKKDSAFLHKESKERYLNHIEERLPFETETTLGFYKFVIRQAKELYETTQKESVKVRALELMKDARKEYQDLLLRGEYVKRSLDAAIEIKKRLDNLPKYQRQEQEQQQSQSSSDQQTSEEVEPEEEEEEPESEAVVAASVEEEDYNLEQNPDDTSSEKGEQVYK
jgi:hypothetical protein